jgi:hypothetical protein
MKKKKITLCQNIFFRKKTITPTFKLNGRSLTVANNNLLFKHIYTYVYNIIVVVLNPLFNTNFISKAVKRVKCGERHETF